MKYKKLKKKNLGIIGTGGFAREVLQLALHIKKNTDAIFDEINFIMFDDFYENDLVDNILVIKVSECDFKNTLFVLGTGDPIVKNRIIKKLPSNINFTSLISPLSFIANDFKYKPGLIVMPFTYISCNVSFGHHVHINSHCTIGHDTRLGNFFTSACSVMISGNNDISENCYFGMNSSTKQGIKITKNVIIGLNSGVVKNISDPGIYIGTPSKLLSL